MECRLWIDGKGAKGIAPGAESRSQKTSTAAQVDDKGGAFAGAISVSPGIWLYQLTDDGLALELTGKGTK